MAANHDYGVKCEAVRTDDHTGSVLVKFDIKVDASVTSAFKAGLSLRATGHAVHIVFTGGKITVNGTEVGEYTSGSTYSFEIVTNADGKCDVSLGGNKVVDHGDMLNGNKNWTTARFYVEGVSAEEGHASISNLVIAKAN